MFVSVYLGTLKWASRLLNFSLKTGTILAVNWIKFFGTSVLNPGAGFLRIFTVAFDRLF